MKTFREHIKEEVKIGALASGGIDIERDAVRDEINGILSAIAVRPCVTPYASLNKIRKALAYFSIFLPKKVYLEGKHGIEVWEVNQFGDKMGFTDQGEWIKNVPCKYYLFFHYHRIGSMYYLEAKIVDDKELESKVSTTEKMFAEEMDAAMRQDLAKAKAPKEDPHTALGDCDCSQGDSPSTKSAVKVSMKKIEEASTEKLIRYRNKAGEGREKGAKLAYAKLTGKAKVSATMPKHSYMEEDKDPCWKGYEMVGMKKKGGRKVPNCVPVKEEEQIDEVSAGLAQRAAHRAFVKSDKMKADAKKEPDMHSYVQAFHKGEKKSKQGVKFAKYAAKKMEEEQIDETNKENKAKKKKWEADKGTKHFKTMGYPAALNQLAKSDSATLRHVGRNSPFKEETISEKAPPGAKFERMVKHIKKGYSKDGLTAKEKGIAYATAWKAKKRESKD